MRILLVHSDSKMAARESIDLWRIIRGFRELAKHVDWQFDYKPYLLEDIPEGGDMPVEDIIKQVEMLGQYDIVWSSYFPDAVLFDIMQFTTEQFGTKFVLDMDDDMFHVPEHNNFKKKAKPGEFEALQYMARETDYLVTSSPILQAEYKKHRSKPTYLLPNYIGPDYRHKPFNNEDKVVIGFFGSVTHANDFSKTGIVTALEKLLKKHKNVHFATVGMEVSGNFPRERHHYYPGKPGTAWLDEVWPNMNIDIAVAPLVDDQFNRCKTNIKWLETALIPAAFVGSDVSPYKEAVENGKTGLLVKNKTHAWFDALEQLITDTELRKRLADDAQTEVQQNWSIETKWQVLKDIVEQIHNDTANVSKKSHIIVA